MSKNLLLILAANVDIWAALLIVHLWQQTPIWGVSMAISDTAAASPLTLSEPIAIWLRPDGNMGIWPQTDQRLTMDQLRHRVSSLAEQSSGPVEVLLMCDRRLTVPEWSAVAVEIAGDADEIRLAPLPE